MHQPQQLPAVQKAALLGSNLFKQVLLWKIIKDLVAWINTTANAIYVHYCSLLRLAVVLLLQIHCTVLLYSILGLLSMSK